MNRFFPFLLCGTLISGGVALAQTPTDDQKPVYKDANAGAEARTEDLLKRLTLEEKIKLLGGYHDFYTQPVERLGLPSFEMTDGPQGVRRSEPSTAYTAGIALAASWDTALAQRVGASYGRDARSRGIYYLLAPGMNLYRAPMNGRNFEYYGEDPVLSGMTAAYFVRGVQSQGVAATIKHFAANNQEYQRHDISSDVEETALRELYLRNFQIAVREGQPKCVMNSYNPINGVHATENPWLNNTVLKGEWGFKGLLMSDWDASYNAEGMANGGLDLEMPSGKFFNEAKLKPLLDSGKVTTATLDDKVRRQLRIEFEMGWFDRPQEDKSIPRDDPASTAANIDEARGGITLLKNQSGLLPLDAGKVKKVVVLGPNSAVIPAGGGSGFVQYTHASSVLEAMRKAAPNPEMVTGITWEPEVAVPTSGQAGVDAVKAADAVVVCVGFNDPGCFSAEHGSFNEREDQDRRYELPLEQEAYIRRLAKLNPKLVVVLNAGGSVATAGWVEQAAALIHAYYPGQEGSVALAEILFGKTNPSGKLPFSWEKRWQDSAAYGNYPSKEHPKSNTYKEGVLLGYRWFDAKGMEPLFPFGFGLSYTKFDLTDFKATKSGDDEVSFSVQVRNSGERAGSQVVQVYANGTGGAEPRAPHELKAYAKVFLQPGESKTVQMKAKVDDLKYWDAASKKWTLPGGEHVFQAGDSSRNLPLKTSVELVGPPAN